MSSLNGMGNQYTEGIYAGKPLTVGDTVEQDIDTTQNGLKIRLRLFYTLKKVTDGIAYFTIKSKMLPHMTENGYTPPNDLKFSGTVKGALEVFIDSGQVNRMNIQLNFKGKVAAGTTQTMSLAASYLIKPFAEN